MRERAAIHTGVKRLTGHALWRAERQETCERWFILNATGLTGTQLMRAAHQEAHERTLAWGLERPAMLALARPVVRASHGQP